MKFPKHLPVLVVGEAILLNQDKEIIKFLKDLEEKLRFLESCKRPKNQLYEGGQDIQKQGKRFDMHAVSKNQFTYLHSSHFVSQSFGYFGEKDSVKLIFDFDWIGLHDGEEFQSHRTYVNCWEYLYQFL